MCGASGIRSLKGGLCHGPAGVPRLATRCLCVLSTWLVVCLVPCARMSIVCPLPSCYLIIVSVAPAVSPSLPSFVSLYSLLVSAVLCWSVVFHVSMSCELNVWLCSSLLPACLFFPFGVVYVLLFHFIIKTLISSAFESSTSSLLTIFGFILKGLLLVNMYKLSTINYRRHSRLCRIVFQQCFDHSDAVKMRVFLKRFHHQISLNSSEVWVW